MTFLPLILWDAKELFGAENNPFSLQFRQGSPIATIFLVTTVLTMSLTWKGNYQLQVLYSVIILLLIPIISYGYSMYIYGNWTDIFNSYEDYRVELHNKYMEMYNNGATQQETWKEHSNEIIEKIAEKYKWKYTRKLPK